jgi:hypothetical protein
LKSRFQDLVGKGDVQESAASDYAYRLLNPKSARVRVLSGFAEEIDYENFKSEVAHHQETISTKIRAFTARCLVGDVQATELTKWASNNGLPRID